MRYRSALILAILIGCGLFTAHYVPPIVSTAEAAGAASGATSNQIGAVGQLTSLFVPAGGCVRVNVSGSFVGTIAFFTNQGGADTAVNLTNLATGSQTDQTTTGTGSWLFTPVSGGDATLIIKASAWTSGTAIVSLVDLAQNTPNLDMVLFPSAARTTQQTINLQNPVWEGIVVYLNVTAASGTGGLEIVVWTVDPVTGNTSDQINSTPTAVTATGGHVYVIRPGGVSGGGPTQTTAQVLPAKIQVMVHVGDASSYTYSVSCSLLK